MDGWQRQDWHPAPTAGGGPGAGGNSGTATVGPTAGSFAQQQHSVTPIACPDKITLYLHQGTYLLSALGQTIVLLATWHQAANNAARAYMVAVALIAQLAAFLSLRCPGMYWKRR